MLNNRFMALTALDNGKVTVSLPFAATVTDVFTGKRIASGKSFEVTLRSCESYFFRLDPVRKKAPFMSLPKVAPASRGKAVSTVKTLLWPQLFKDGDFEGKSTNWRPLINGKVEKFSRFAARGKHCARVTAVTPGKAASVYCSRFADGLLIGRRMMLDVLVRGEGVARMVVLPYAPGTSKTTLHRGEKIKLSPDKWQRVSFIYDPGTAVTARIAPAIELESGKEFFMDDFRIFNAPESGNIKAEKSYILAPVGKSVKFRCTGAKPLSESRLYMLDPSMKYTVFTARADKAGVAVFDLQLKKTGSFQLVAASGGSNTAALVEAAPQKELDLLQQTALRSKIPANSHILILGDSLSDFLRGRNYADKIALFLKHKNVTVKNAGVKGDMITRVRDRITGVKTYRPKGYNGIFTPMPDIAMIFLGHNDTVLRDGKIQVPFDEGEKAFRQVLTLLRKKNPKMKIYLLTPVCALRSVCLANMEKRMKRGFGRIEFGRPELLEQYIRMLKTLAKEFDCQIVDVYTPMKKMKDTVHLFNPGDGVHISEAGNRYVALEVLKHL